MPQETVNEITFVARLAAATAVRAERLRQQGQTPLIFSGEVEETQRDASGRVRRCDMRLNSVTRRKLASGEMKRPELPEGKDPRNQELVSDARNKALARGLPYYFTCNMAEVVLFAVASKPREADREETSYQLAPITHSGQTDAYRDQINQVWIDFLDDLEARLKAVAEARPSVTNADVLLLRDAINVVAEEAVDRVERAIRDDQVLRDVVRREAEESFEFRANLDPSSPAEFRGELLQLLRFGLFVIAQKLVLYRVLEDAGRRRTDRFELDHLTVPDTSTDPDLVRRVLDQSFSQAIIRSGDYETAFRPEPLVDLVFIPPKRGSEIEECKVGEVWSRLVEAVSVVSWLSISQNLIGFLYELLVDPGFRHILGQFYTREDVVEPLVTFAIRDPGDFLLDPASGGGSFLRAAYLRKRALGDTHEGALERIWGCEITAFAAELSTITLATSDTTAAAAYPRVILRDFFETRPGQKTDLSVPSEEEVSLPASFDAVVGNPPYISYRRQKNQQAVLKALTSMSSRFALPRFSGKSDSSVWFVVHSTRFLKEGGRLAFVLTAAILYDDYGIPLIRLLARHFKIRAVVDSMVERWFIDADANTFLLMAERCNDDEARAANLIRFIRLRRPLTQLLGSPEDKDRRQRVEDFVDTLLNSDPKVEDPRMLIEDVPQGSDGGLVFFEAGDHEDSEESED